MSRSASSARRSGSSRPGGGSRSEFTCLFVGKLIPLHGLETILEAARRAPELRFRVVGSGQLEPLLDARPANVEWRRVGRVRAAARRAARVRLRARHLRHVAEGAARHPEQGVPGAGVRRAGRHRRHACRARAARPTRRARCSSRRAMPDALVDALRRLAADPGARAAHRRRADASAYERARERGDTRRTMARADRRAPLALWLGVGAFAAGFGALSMLRHRSFETGRFDLGNMVQAVWFTAHGHPLRVTNLRGEQVLAARRAPRPGARAVRAALVDLAEPRPAARRAVGGARARRAARLLARAQAPRLAPRGRSASRSPTSSIPRRRGSRSNEFHPGRARDARCCCSRSGTSTRTASSRSRSFALLAAICREEMPLVVAGFGVWYALARGRRREGLTIAAASVVWTLVARHARDPALPRRADALLRALQRGGAPAASAPLRRTLSSASRSTTSASRYLLTLVLPLAGLCLLAPIALAALPRARD